MSEQHTVGDRLLSAAGIDWCEGRAVYGTGAGISRWSHLDAGPDAKAAIRESPYEDFDRLEAVGQVPGAGLRQLQRHLDRLAGSASYFPVPFDRDRARARVVVTVAGLGPARVRLRLARSGTLSVEVTKTTVENLGVRLDGVRRTPLSGSWMLPAERGGLLQLRRLRGQQEAAARVRGRACGGGASEQKLGVSRTTCALVRSCPSSAPVRARSRLLRPHEVLLLTP